MSVGILALKCKLISLALEAQGIRSQERRINKQLRKLLASEDAKPEYVSYTQISQDYIRAHRVTVVRNESRLSHWAYAYLRGQSHEVCEAKPGRPLSAAEVDKLKNMVCRFSTWSKPFKLNEFSSWVLTAQDRCNQATKLRAERDEQRIKVRATRKEQRAKELLEQKLEQKVA